MLVLKRVWRSLVSSRKNRFFSYYMTAYCDDAPFQLAFKAVQHIHLRGFLEPSHLLIPIQST